jgi:type IV secretion system coupling TraD/TrwB family protein
MTMHVYDIRPSGQVVRLADLPLSGPKEAVGQAPADAKGGLCLPRRVERTPELAALARVLGIPTELGHAWGPDLNRLAQVLAQPALDGTVVEFKLQRFPRKAPLLRALADIYLSLARQLEGAAGKNPVARAWIEQQLRTLAPWYAAKEGVRLMTRLSAPAPLPAPILDLVSRTLYGSALARDGEEDLLYFGDAWPTCDLAFLEALPAFVAKHKAVQARKKRLAAAERPGVRLGAHAEDASPVVLGNEARAQHLYMIGGTGTGKSTLMANMIVQDMEAGEAIVVIDPHGSLVEDVLRLVPKKRKKDVVYLHPTDPKGAFTLNLLEPLSSDLAVERNRCANDLIALMKIVYPEPPEAYGPMFQNYFRNALFLVLGGREDKATLAEVRRVFADENFRQELTFACPIPDVQGFWRDIAENIRHSGENASISNVAPYIDAKLTQLSGNPVVERIIGKPKSTIDFRKIVAEKRICLINLAQGLIGSSDARFLGGLLLARLSAYLKMHAMAHAQDAQRAPLPLRVYLDEVQSYADEALAESMAQMRKFGLSYVLANQNFAQITGRGWRPNVGQEILGNAGSIVAFRISNFDAELLAPWFFPTVRREDLIQLPNYRAAVRLLPGAEPCDPFVFKTDPPPVR